MKKLIALTVLLTLGVGCVMARNQEESTERKHAVGIDVNYATQIDQVGIGAKYQWKVGKKKRLYIEPNFHYFLKKDGVSVIEVGVNFKWAYPLIENKFKVYPLVGLGYANTNTDATNDSPAVTETKLEWDLGVGAQYDFTDRWAGTFEFRRASVNDGMLVFGLGALYKF